MPKKKKSDIKPKKTKQSRVKKEPTHICPDLESNNVRQFKIQDKPEYKCFTFFDNDPTHYKIYKELGKISKNVYNLSIYSIQVFNYFKLELYANLKDELDKDINFDTYKYINSKLIYYFDLYFSLKDKLKCNNNYIYKYIIDYINVNKIIIKNSNYDQTIDILFGLLTNDRNIYKDNKNDDLLFNQIVIKIVNSIYTKNYMRSRNEILEHKKLTIYDAEIIEDIKKDRIRDFSTKNIYKQQIKDMLKTNNKTKLTSDQNYIGRLVYAKLGYNYGKLQSTMIGSIISRAHQAYSSYFASLNKGIKAKHPKFLKKDEIYNLIYTFSEISKDDKFMNLFTSDYISNNYEPFKNKLINIAKYIYVDNKHLLPINGKKIPKKDNYIFGNKYIHKKSEHIINSKYIKINMPEKAQKYKTKIVEVVFINNTVKICMSYETEHVKKPEQEIEISAMDSISIDLGVKNLLTIYNPTGKQNIIDGKFISSINFHYNKLISKAQSRKDINLFHKLHLRRKNIINNYFNKVVKWMEKEYVNKKLIILGYNKEWKNGINLGKTNNKKFYGIPYTSIINKIRTKFIENDKIVMITEESYTSKCDALAGEKICYHDKYLGNRSKRGLFESSEGKLINADINGAINIMRKIYSDYEVIGRNNICNPMRINIFREVRAQPADKRNSSAN